MSQRRGGDAGGGGRGGGGGGGASGGSRSLLSGKAKKEMMKEKREKDRIRAEKFAAWEKRQQAAEEQQRNAHLQQQQQHTGGSEDEDDGDDGEPQQHQHDDVQQQQQRSRTEPLHQVEDDDGVLVHRRIQKATAPSSSAASSSAASSAAGIAAESGGRSTVPAFAPLESSGVESRNKLRTLFVKESKEEIEKRKAESRKPLKRTGPMDGSCPSVDYYRELDEIPLRPAWSACTGRAELHEQERRSFAVWLSGIYGRFPAARLNHFEHNLEVWRQLWRVCEQSDLLLCIVDVRFPLINFPPALYRYVTGELGKGLLLVLNKIDLVPPRAVQAWREYFHRVYPVLHVVAYSSQPRGETGSNDSFDVLSRNRVKVGGGLVLGAAYGVHELMQRCRAVLQETARGVSDEVKAGFSFEPTAITLAEGEDTAADEKDGQQGDEDADGKDEDDREQERDDDEEEEKKAGKGEQHGRGRSQRKGRRRTHRGGTGERDGEEDRAGEEEEEEEEAAAAEQPTPAPPPAKYSALFGSLEEQQPSSSLPPAAAPSSSSSFLTVGTIGCPNSGKCFARGTQLRLYNGDLIAVENIVGGEQLMGDDGTARTVTPGSLTQPGSRDVLYTITPQSEGAEPFTVNGGHVLVLSNNARPWSHLEPGRHGRGAVWRARWCELDTDNVLRVRQRSYDTEQRALHEVDKLTADWAPLEWEVSVRDFLAAPSDARRLCQLMAADAVTFVSPQLPGLARVLNVVLGHLPTPGQVDWAAWYLGLWLTDGVAGRADVSQGGPVHGQRGSHCEIRAELRRYQLLFGEPVMQQFDETSTAGRPMSTFQFGQPGVCGGFTASVAHRLLQQYGLIDSKHVPQAWICDSLDVRRRIFAGIVDGNGDRAADSRNCYDISAKQLRVAQGCRLLGASLGLRSGAIRCETSTDEWTGRTITGHRQRFSGPLHTVSLHVVCSYSKRPQPQDTNCRALRQDSRYGFTIRQQPIGDYFGFAVHGGANRRFLLADFTITHNSSLINSLCRRKLVSVSKTPGHTKYLQTIFLNRFTRLADCFSESDTRILTNCGLLFLDEIEQLLDKGPAVLFGCYDKETKALRYCPGQLVYRAPPQELLVFNSKGEDARWADASGDYGKEAVPEDNPQSRHVSLRVTPGHDMFVQHGNRHRTDASVAWARLDNAVARSRVEPARSLLSDCRCPREDDCVHRRAHIRLLACAEAGYAPQSTTKRATVLAVQADLHLDDTQFAAFIELLGFWLADGSLDYNPALDGSASGYVTFSQVKQADLTWLRSLLKKAGLKEDEHWLTGSSVRPQTTLYITKPAWVAFFDAEFGGKSVKQLPDWTLQELPAAEMRLLISGLHRADGSFAAHEKEIYTSSTRFRDQLMQALLHCGYSAWAGLKHCNGAVKGYNFHDQSKDKEIKPVAFYEALSAAEKRKYRPIQAAATGWRVAYTELVSTVAASSCWPSMRRQSGITRVPYSAVRDGRTWCVEVEHKDHLIIAQRAQRDADGIVTKQSRPIVVGNCPGLVFPAVDMPKALQVLAGCFPIAQTRDPYSAVRMLAEAVPLERVYKLRPTPVDERGEFTYGDGEDEAEAGRAGWQWTAWSICEAFAHQKGFRNRHGVLDLYRAANAICRDALEGRVVMFTLPPAQQPADSSRAQPADGRRGEGEGRQDRAAATGGPREGKGRPAVEDDEEQLTAGRTRAARPQRRQQRHRRESVDDDEDD